MKEVQQELLEKVTFSSYRLPEGYLLATVDILVGNGNSLLFWIQATGNMARWGVTLRGVALGVIIYGSAITALRVPEIQSAIQFVARRVKP